MNVSYSLLSFYSIANMYLLVCSLILIFKMFYSRIAGINFILQQQDQHQWSSSSISGDANEAFKNINMKFHIKQF